MVFQTELPAFKCSKEGPSEDSSEAFGEGAGLEG